MSADTLAVMGLRDPLIPEGMETVAQAASRIKRSPGFVRALIRRRLLKAHDVLGVRETLIRTDELDRLLQPRERGTKD